MPDSQENEWQESSADYAEFEDGRTDWEEVIQYFQTAIDSFQRIGPVVVEATERIQHMAQSNSQDYIERPIMAINTRHGEYPGRDGEGTYWYDPSTFHTDEPGACFMCKRNTHRVDIDYHGYFCGSEECNEAIRKELERLNGGPENG